jgi:hypothetical protein
MHMHAFLRISAAHVVNCMRLNYACIICLCVVLYAIILCSRILSRACLHALVGVRGMQCVTGMCGYARVPACPCVCLHACACMRVCLRVGGYRLVCVCAALHAWSVRARACQLLFVHAFQLVCLRVRVSAVVRVQRARTCVCACVLWAHTCMHACVHGGLCLHACALVRFCVCLRVCMLSACAHVRVWWCACVRTSLCITAYVCMLACIPACQHAFVCVSFCVCMRACMRLVSSACLLACACA